jgi:hypothetical protein
MQKVYAIHKLNSGYYCDHTTGLGEANDVEFEMQIIPSARCAIKPPICHPPCDHKQPDQGNSDFESGQ